VSIRTVKSHQERTVRQRKAAENETDRQRWGPGLGEVPAVSDGAIRCVTVDA
jgi:hypothetical protein